MNKMNIVLAATPLKYNPCSCRRGNLTWMIGDGCVYRLKGDLHPLSQKKKIE